MRQKKASETATGGGVQKMTNEEFLKDFMEFQENFEAENEQWFAEVSTMVSTTWESPDRSAKK